MDPSNHLGKHKGPGHCWKIKKWGLGVQGCDPAGAAAVDQLWALPGLSALSALTVPGLGPVMPPLLPPS